LFRRILASLIIIPILLLLVYGYLQLRKSTANNKDALSVLPENAMVLMEWHGMNDLIEDIKNAYDSSLQKHFLNQQYISSCFHFMETIKQNISNENGLVNAFKSNNVYTALYQSSNKSYNWFFCTTIPKEIDETAYIDGYSFPKFFMKIFLPLIKSGIGVTAFFCFMFSWVELLLARTLTSVNAKPIAATMTRTVSAAGMDWGVLAAAGTLTIVPGALVIWFVRHYIAKGFAMGRV
jgi:hypothetical protein